MSYVPIVPIITPEAPPSRQTQELADLLGRVVQEYEKAHPTVSGAEVAQALQLAKRASAKAGGEAKAIFVGLAAGLALMVGLGVFFMVQRGGDFDAQGPWPVAAVVVALGVAFAFVAILRRKE